MKFTPLFFVVVFALLWAYGDLLPFGSEVTIYDMSCLGQWTNGKCIGQERTNGTTTYKAFPEQQTVVWWYGPPDSSEPQRYWHCAVRDARNWTCQNGITLEELPAIQFKMIDGEMQGLPVGEFPFYTVSKWHWWQVRLSEKIDAALSRK